MLGLLLTASARAQQPEELSIQRTLVLAEQRNLDLLAARIGREVAKAGVRTAGQWANPTVLFSASRDLPHESLLFDQPVDIGGVRHRRIALAKEAAGLTDEEIAALERQVRRRARAAFYGALYARSVTAQRKDAYELARRLREIAGARFDAGDVPQLEVLQADLELAQAGAGLAVTKNDEQVALSRLNTVINEPAEKEWQFTGTLDDIPGDLTPADLRERAIASNSELQRLAQELRIEHGQEALVKTQRFPQLTLEAGVDLNSPPDYKVGGRGGFSLTLPLLYRNQGEIAESQARARRLELQTQAMQRNVTGEVQANYLEWNARRTEATLYRQTVVPTAQKLSKLAEESYRAGEVSILTVLDTQRNVQRVQNEYLTSLLAVQTSFAALEETVGAPLD